jgi:DNA-binding MarR family transcriptional regulator
MAHASVLRHLESDMVNRHAMGMSEYEVLLRLVNAPRHSVRMSALSEDVFLSRSGLTRVVDRLEAEGLVIRTQCPTDRRGAFAVLTRKGAQKLRQVTPTHVDGVREHFLARLTPAQRADLQRALEPLVEAAEPIA